MTGDLGKIDGNSPRQAVGNGKHFKRRNRNSVNESMRLVVAEKGMSVRVHGGKQK
jgi:hypothetical protein